HAQWFETPLPGRLSDVFGLKTNAFYRSDAPLAYSLGASSVTTATHYYEVPVPTTAKVLATFDNTPDHTPAVTINTFGKGTALYLATEPAPSAMAPVLGYAYGLAGIKQGPQTPDGVYARVVDGRTLYVNTTRETQRIPITGTKTGLITHRRHEGTLVLDPQEADLLP
ncbi:beta-galactosidase trimerization domain-containing protein, partial [Azospirillum sp. B4]|uniref:beta-galactosidase trimerization domain-containing protein n=1 Tax=Azospirillum sp. B4 TaxID=95605 RepID=UPI0005CA2EFE